VTSAASLRLSVVIRKELTAAPGSWRSDVRVARQLATVEGSGAKGVGLSDNEDIAGGVTPGAKGIGPFSDPTISDPAESTPLEDDESSEAVPRGALWAMKDRRHLHLLPENRGAKQIRASLGVGDNEIYAIDDGHTHCMISRRVGASPDGLTYYLVARITLEQYLTRANGEHALNDIFADAHDVELCGVYEDQKEVSNILPVQHFAHGGDVPRQYLPPSPFIEFSEDLSADP
jgi:hypothetical protein